MKCKKNDEGSTVISSTAVASTSQDRREHPDAGTPSIGPGRRLGKFSSRLSQGETERLTAFAALALADLYMPTRGFSSIGQNDALSVCTLPLPPHIREARPPIFTMVHLYFFFCLLRTEKMPSLAAAEQDVPDSHMGPASPSPRCVFCRATHHTAPTKRSLLTAFTVDFPDTPLVPDDTQQ